ncbi:MAG: DUF2799 domain-containing protein [Steroidobacteraceae bacterium]
MHLRIAPSLAAGLAVAALALGGCASMSANECRAVDWRTVGYEDGVAGYSGDRIAQHRRACAKHGVTPDLGQYQAGRTEGLREYCQPSNGFRVGAHGGGYAGVCPADLDAAFVGAYDSGRQLHYLETRVANAAHELESKRRELDHAEDRMVRTSALIVAGDTPADLRAQALVDTKQLAERAGRLKSEIRELERDRARYERELEDYRVTLAWIG